MIFLVSLVLSFLLISHVEHCANTWQQLVRLLHRKGYRALCTLPNWVPWLLAYALPYIYLVIRHKECLTFINCANGFLCCLVTYPTIHSLERYQETSVLPGVSFRPYIQDFTLAHAEFYMKCGIRTQSYFCMNEYPVYPGWFPEKIIISPIQCILSSSGLTTDTWISVQAF